MWKYLCYIYIMTLKISVRNCVECIFLCTVDTYTVKFNVLYVYTYNILRLYNGLIALMIFNIPLPWVTERTRRAKAIPWMFRRSGNKERRSCASIRQQLIVRHGGNYRNFKTKRQYYVQYIHTVYTDPRRRRSATEYVCAYAYIHTIHIQ